MTIETLKTWDLSAAKLIQPMLDLLDVDCVAVGARAKAAATLRELLMGRERFLSDAKGNMRRAPDAYFADVEREERLCAALRAVINVIDAGGACTQEIEDDAKNAARRQEDCGDHCR